MKNLIRIVTHTNGRITWQIEAHDKDEAVILAASAQHFPNIQLAIAAAKRVCTAGASAPVTFSDYTYFRSTESSHG